MGIAANVSSAVETTQLAFGVIQSVLVLTAHLFPPPCPLKNNSYVDYIIVGCGSAGSVLATRLSEDENATVLALEAGEAPPIESVWPATFTLLPLTDYDYNFSTFNDGCIAQNLIGKNVGATQGKTIGGSGSIGHMTYVRANKFDFDEWVNITGDNAWSYDNVQKYMNMQENLTDIEILNSTFASNHGTSGPKKISRQKSATSQNILKSFEEIGHKIVLDISDKTQLGCNEPLFNVADGKRQSNAIKYLELAKNRNNLCLSTSSTVIKIIINNGIASGVQVVDKNGNFYNIYARREVVISAGAINSPKLLQLSGVGKKKLLRKFGIHSVADLPAGDNLQDHASVLLAYTMGASNAPTPAVDPERFPINATTLYAALDSEQKHPDYQAITGLFSHDSITLVQFISRAFKYNNEFTDSVFRISKGKDVLLALVNLMKPKSRGTVSIKSANYKDDPLINLGTFSDCYDVNMMAKYLKDFNRIVNTTFFKSVKAQLVDPGLCTGKEDMNFWRCQAVALSNTMWHYTSTCAMGSVTDSKLRVKGIQNLRVIDASSMPTVPSGNIEATVTMLAEKGAALIKSTWLHSP